MALLFTFVLVFTSIYAEDEKNKNEDRTNFDAYCIFGGIISEETAEKQGTYTYQEMCFMTGKPVLLTGTIDIPKIGKATKGEKRIQVAYNHLANDDERVVIDRTVNYILKTEKDPETKKEFVSWDINKGGIDEAVTLNGKNFTITSFDFDKDASTSENPAVRYTSSKIYYKKVFKEEGNALNKGVRIIVEGNSLADLSYKNMWSGVHSVVMNQNIRYETLNGSQQFEDKGAYSEKAKKLAEMTDEDKQAEKESKGLNNWYGDYKYKFSYKEQSSFSSYENTVRNIDFRKVYNKNTNFSNQITYTYDMPDFSKDKKEKDPNADSKDIKDEKEIDLGKEQERIIGEFSLEAYEYENSELLNTPQYKDIAEHWAEKYIIRMASMGAFDLDTAFFPDVNIDRKQFARAVINTIDSVKPETEEERKSEAIKAMRPNAKLRFTDVNRDDEYFIFIDRVAEKGIMLGKGNRHFMPNKHLTREEAITVIIRALGLDSRAPIMPFDTGFTDDAEISTWAKPSIYMAKEIGLIEGYGGKVMPKRYMTRAEASTLLSKLVEHLRVEMVKDYSESLLSDY